MTAKVFWSVLLTAAAVIPAAVGIGGFWNWGLGLWLGEGVGLGAFLWIRWSVQRALAPGAGNPMGLLMHSLARLTTVGLVFFLVLKFPALSIWAVLIGYTLIQLPTAVWQRVAATERK